MLGIETIPGGQLVAPRYPTGAEQAKWDKALIRLDALSTKVYSLKLLNWVVAAQMRFSQQSGIAIHLPADLEQKVLTIDAELGRIKDAVRQVDEQRLALQFVNGDFNIVRPQQQQLDGVFIPIIAGAVIGVVVYGVIDALITGDEQCNELIEPYNQLIDYNEEKFCTEGTPEQCQQWNDFKEELDLVRKRGAAQAWWKKAIRDVSQGLGWGLAIAIPVALGLMVWQKTK